MPVVILIGASGSGKTTIARAVLAKHPKEIDVLHFDQIGVPSAEQMIAEYGSGEAWQRVKTIEWMAKLAEIGGAGRPLLFEGQTRLSSLVQGATQAGGFAYEAILVDCDDQTRIRRLGVDRAQPELADSNMMNWAAWLRRDALERGSKILDTSALSLDACVAFVIERLRRPDAERPARSSSVQLNQKA